MGLVGPRPILPAQVEVYGDAYADYVKFRPGMTGLWQVSGRNRLSFEERVQIDREYFGSRSISLDLKIMAKTVAVVLRGDGAY
jgi:exopolysaccharide production protein ExoY